MCSLISEKASWKLEKVEQERKDSGFPEGKQRTGMLAKIPEQGKQRSQQDRGDDRRAAPGRLPMAYRHVSAVGVPEPDSAQALPLLRCSVILKLAAARFDKST